MNRRWQGTDNFKARLDEDDVRFIRNAVSNGVTQESLAIRFGVTPAAINHIIKKRTWSWLDE